jgi:hypothetical protein
MTKEPFGLLSPDALLEHGNRLDHHVDVARTVRIGTGRFVGLLVQELLGSLAGRSTVLADERANVEEEACAGVQQRIEAAVVLPDGLIALRMSKDGAEANTNEIEEAMLELGREPLRAQLDEHTACTPRASRRRRGSGVVVAVRGASRGSAEVGVGKTLSLEEAPEDDVVEEVFARQVYVREVTLPDEARAHRSKRHFERPFVVVEHAWAHVRCGHDEVEPRAVETAKQIDAFLGRLHAVVDPGDPVAVQIDEASHV